MKRENGFYWVKLAGDWQVAEYGNNSWFLTGIDVCYENFINDSDFNEIDERRIINPNE